MKSANLFLNGSFCDYRNIVSTSFFSIAADGGVLTAIRNNITPDIIIGDGDSLKGIPVKYQKNVDSIPFLQMNNQDYTDFEKSLHYLEKHLFTDIYVYSFEGSRIDHILAGLSAVAVSKIHNITLYTHTQRIVKLPRQYCSIGKKNRVISLIPYPTARKVTTQNMQWNVQNKTFSTDSFVSISNVSLTEKCQIEYVGGCLFLIEDINDVIF